MLWNYFRFRRGIKDMAGLPAGSTRSLVTCIPANFTPSRGLRWLEVKT
jgi:hypothetical protein